MILSLLSTSSSRQSDCTPCVPLTVRPRRAIGSRPFLDFRKRPQDHGNQIMRAVGLRRMRVRWREYASRLWSTDHGLLAPFSRLESFCGSRYLSSALDPGCCSSIVCNTGCPYSLLLCHEHGLLLSFVNHAAWSPFLASFTIVVAIPFQEGTLAPSLQSGSYCCAWHPPTLLSLSLLSSRNVWSECTLCALWMLRSRRED